MNFCAFLQRVSPHPNCLIGIMCQLADGSYQVQPVKYLIFKQHLSTVDLYPATEAALLENRDLTQEYLTLNELRSLLRILSSSMSPFKIAHESCLRFVINYEEHRQVGARIPKTTSIESFWSPEELVNTWYKKEPILALSSLEANKFKKYGI